MARREEPLLQAVFNHIALPPRLPGRMDEEMEDVEMALVTRLLKAVDDIHTGESRIVEKAADGGWSSLRRSLELCRTIRGDGRVLSEILSEIQRGDGVTIHVAEQNAGLLV